MYNVEVLDGKTNLKYKEPNILRTSYFYRTLKLFYFEIRRNISCVINIEHTQAAVLKICYHKELVRV